MRWGEMRLEELTWFEMRWSVECEVQVWSVKSGVWSVKKVFAWRCIAPGSHRSCSWTTTMQQVRTKRARAWLVHGACKFYYRWKRSYIITLRQLPPRLVRVLLVPSRMGINNHDNPCGNWRFAAVQFPISSQSWHASDVERPEIASSSCWSVQILGSTRCAPRFAPHGQMAQAVPCCQDPFAIVVANIKVLKRKNKSSNTQLWHVDTPWINRIIVWFVQKLGTPNNPMHWSYVGFPIKYTTKGHIPFLVFHHLTHHWQQRRSTAPDGKKLARPALCQDIVAVPAAGFPGSPACSCGTNDHRPAQSRALSVYTFYTF